MNDEIIDEIINDFKKYEEKIGKGFDEYIIEHQKEIIQQICNKYNIPDYLCDLISIKKV